jgi:hypothetical protein
MPNDKSPKMTELNTVTDWYRQLVRIRSFLETMRGEYLDDDQMRSLGIHMSNLDLEIDESSDSASQFFRPFPREHLKISSCAVDPAEHTSLPQPTDRKKYCRDFNLGRSLVNVVRSHLGQIHTKYPGKWDDIGYGVAISAFKHEPS